MKKIIIITSLFLISIHLYSQTTDSLPDPAKKTYVVDAASGQCQFGLKGNGCQLAIRFNGKAYWVDGTGIDDHGDAHADDGFCNAVRKARVQGKVVNNRFRASYFKLLPGRSNNP